MKNISEIRLDKWLWHVRIFKTRTLCTNFIRKKGININGVDVFKSATTVKENDVLFFDNHKALRIIKILIIPCRRVNFDLAKKMYEDLSLEMLKK